MEESATIYDWLAEVEKRPGMYFVRLHDLEVMIRGYMTALGAHRIDERAPDMLHFGDWLRRRTGWSMSCGWAAAFDEHVPSDQHVERFFELLADFRTLDPVVVASVTLREHHQPTGKRVVIGHNGRLPRPDRVEVIRYAPEPLYFLRFHYADRLEVQRLLQAPHPKGGLTVETTLDHARAWVAAELDVAENEWDDIAST